MKVVVRVVMVAMLVVAVVAGWAGPSYRVVDLGTLPGCTISDATAINDRGEVIGVADGQRSFVWQGGKMVDLGASTRAIAIDNQSRVAGFMFTSEGEQHACIWLNSKQPKDLNDWLPAESRWTLQSANGIDADRVVGAMVDRDNLYSGFVLDLKSRKLTQLDTASSAASSISQNTVAGSRAESEPRACAWSANGYTTDLGILAGFQRSYAVKLNAARQIVGDCYNFDNSNQAFVWEKGKMSALPNPGRCTDSQAFDISNSGAVVGSAWWLEPVGYNMWIKHIDACVWFKSYFTGWHAANLNTWVAPDSDWKLRKATGINNAGWIVGQGTVQSPEGLYGFQTHAFLLIPK